VSEVCVHLLLNKLSNSRGDAFANKLKRRPNLELKTELRTKSKNEIKDEIKNEILNKLIRLFLDFLNMKKFEIENEKFGDQNKFSGKKTPCVANYLIFNYIFRVLS